MEIISRDEISREIDHWIYYENLEGKKVFRELEDYGNRHVVFEKGSQFGTVHNDQYNATTFPVGTVNHIARWANEKSGVDEVIARLAIWGLGLFAAYKIAKHL